MIAASRRARTKTRPRGFLRRVAAPLASWAPVGIFVILVGWAAANWLYQTYHKPTELFFPVSGALTKTPQQTWREYGPLFREHATAVISPDLLAAIAQVEGSGNPVARTYWRWQVTSNPFDLYRPASSAVGMYQITDAAFREARRLCIHDHRVAEEGLWHDPKSCWFNGLYMRILPSHSIELTAAMLDRKVAAATAGRRPSSVTLQQKQRLAAVIHLCGAGAGYAYARRGYQSTAGQRCGDHDVRRYLAQVNAMKLQFGRLEAAG